jgi:rhodanese-related sulfurtransferase/DNA-binding transcriptional ArsR family regulator
MNPKAEIFEQFADLARVLGQGNRLELLEHAAQGERSVERLAQLTGLSVANASQHLQVLRRAGFVRSRRDGKHVLYRLGDGPVVELLGALRRYAEHSRAEVRGIVSAYFHKLDSLEPVSREALLERLDDGSTLLLDVRPEDEFVLGHLPGALNIPLADLERRLAELPSDSQIVAYCRGPYCVLSFEAVAALRAKGYDVRRLEEGFPEWKAAGLPLGTESDDVRPPVHS